MGDASDDRVLMQAGIARAKALATVLPTDADNVYVALTARLLSSKLEIIARASDEAAALKLERAGANRVVSPYSTGAQKIARFMLNPNIEDFLEIADHKGQDLELADVQISADSPYVGKKLMETDLRDEGVMIVGIRRRNGERLMPPPGNAVIEAGDCLFAFGSTTRRQSHDRRIGGGHCGGSWDTGRRAIDRVSELTFNLDRVIFHADICSRPNCRRSRRSAPRRRRVLGTMIEKALTVPESYPMTLKALTTGCNQKSARHPLTNYQEDDIEETLGELARTGAGGGRAHRIGPHRTLSPLRAPAVQHAVGTAGGDSGRAAAPRPAVGGRPARPRQPHGARRFTRLARTVADRTDGTACR